MKILILISTYLIFGFILRVFPSLHPIWAYSTGIILLNITKCFILSNAAKFRYLSTHSIFHINEFSVIFVALQRFRIAIKITNMVLAY